ncbi:MAG TPA: hypothetical protein VFG11_08080, partial [Acidobacteriota bacterium]|nr:hypothetical protein [Acidobacteriota bacterium]
FVPENIPAGTYVIELGMYQTSGRGELMQLNAPKRGDRAYDLGRIQIALPSSKAEYVSGWYDAESEPQERWYHWRWMGKSAVLRVENPKADSLLYLKAAAELTRFPKSPQVRVSVNGQEIDSFEVDTPEFSKMYHVAKKDLGPGERVELKVETDATFVPASDKVSQDRRELGLKVFLFYLGKASD